MMSASAAQTSKDTLAPAVCCVYTTICCSLRRITVYNRIALFRADRGLSRRALADAVGVNPQTIGYLERGDYKPSLELALKVAEHFAVPVELLFSLTPFPPMADALRREGAG
jgi:DNA-binding XRE family transcriptional regulator